MGSGLELVQGKSGGRVSCQKGVGEKVTSCWQWVQSPLLGLLDPVLVSPGETAYRQEDGIVIGTPSHQMPLPFRIESV